MGLNRMMMKNGEVKVEDGSKYWTRNEVSNKTIDFTVPPGVKRIKVVAEVDRAEEGESWDAYINNFLNRKKWGNGYSETAGSRYHHRNINSIVGVTPNKTYALYFECYYTSGVTFSWGKAINDMKPTAEDY